MERNSVSLIRKILKGKGANFDDYIVYEVPLEFSKKFISAYSIKQDLQFVRKVLRKIHSIRKQQSEVNSDELIVTSLWFSAIIIYGKCFADASQAGNTKLERNQCFEDNDRMNAYHDQLIMLRHKYVAHRGDTEYDESIVVLPIHKSLREDPITLPYTVLNVRFTSPGEKDVCDYIELIDFLIKYVDKMLDKRGERMNNAFQNLNPEQIRALIVQL